MTSGEQRLISTGPVAVTALPQRPAFAMAWRNPAHGMSKHIARIQRHWADPESRYRKIATNFIWIFLFVVIGKMVGAAKEMTIAWRYGVSETVDAYVFVYNLVNMPISIWFSVLPAVLVPMITRLQHDAPGELQRFHAELLGFTILFGVGLRLFAWLGLPALLRAGWLGLSGNALNEALDMTGGMALLGLFGSLISLFSAWLLAAGQNRNTLFEAIPAFVILVALLLPPDYMPEPLIWGTVGGIALHLVALAAPLGKHGKLPSPIMRQKSQVWKGFWPSIRILIIGQVLMNLTNLIDLFFAADFGAGAISMMNYANRIVSFVLGLITIAISRATLPVFSEEQLKGVAATTLVRRLARWMFLLGLGFFLTGELASTWIVKSLFERGAFTETDSAQVVEMLRYALVQVPFYAYAMVLVSYISSQQKYSILLISSMIAVLVKTISVIYLTSSMRMNGIILSTTIVYLIGSLFFYFWLNYREYIKK